MTETTYSCPECGSKQVTTEHHQMFMRNTGEHYCHIIKTHHSDSPATCLDCGWEGFGGQLKEKTHETTQTR